MSRMMIMHLTQKAVKQIMILMEAGEQEKRNLIAAVEADAKGARDRAARLRNIAQYIVGDTKLMLMQADIEELSVAQYEKLAEYMKKEWQL